jgi:putative peptidoglycan lipid II flippase
MRLMLMLNVPAMIGLIVLAEPIVALLYQRGQFTDADTQATAAALRFYAPGLIGYSIVRIASPTFYSLGNSRTPVIVSVASVSVNLILNILLVRAGMGFRGLALGTAIAALFNALTLLWLLRDRLQGIDGRRVMIAFGKISGAAVVMGIVASLVAARLEAALPGSSELVRALRVAIAIATALVALVVSARLLRIEEFTDATERVLRRVLPARR